jgi:hypothetical protein
MVFRKLYHLYYPMTFDFVYESCFDFKLLNKGYRGRRMDLLCWCSDQSNFCRLRL